TPTTLSLHDALPISGLLEIREHGLPARRPVHFGSFGLDVPIHPREYTTRWWWGEPDLRSITPIDRHLLHRRGRLGGLLRGPCGRDRKSTRLNSSHVA